MNTLKLSGLALLLGSNIVSAALPCDGFVLNVKNKLADDLLVTTVKLENADLTPNTLERINAREEQFFVVNNTIEPDSMNGEFVFNTITIPYKTVKIKFQLANRSGVCEYTTLSVEGDYSVIPSQIFNQADFTIVNK